MCSGTGTHSFVPRSVSPGFFSGLHVATDTTEPIRPPDAFGADDAVVILGMPDNVTAAALAFSVAASGLVHIRTTPLLTIEETDQAVSKSVNYRPVSKGLGRTIAVGVPRGRPCRAVAVSGPFAKRAARTPAGFARLRERGRLCKR